MMPNFVENKDIDKGKWDFCIKNSVNGIIYAYSWYLDIVSPGWNALITDDYTTVMPLPDAYKLGFKYIFPPPFTQQLGVFSVAGITGEKVNLFFDKIPRNYKYVEMNLNTLNPAPNNHFEKRNLLTHLLDLISPYDRIYSNYSTQTKRNLRKAMLNKLEVRKDMSPMPVIDLFRKNRGREFKHPATYYHTLNALMNACLKRNMGQIWTVLTEEKELCAGAFFTGSNKREIFLFSGINTKGYQLHAMTLLMDRFFRDHAEQEITFDFEGSLNPDIARFYKGFGSKEIIFSQIRRNNLPFPFKWVKDIQFRRNRRDFR